MVVIVLDAASFPEELVTTTLLVERLEVITVDAAPDGAADSYVPSVWYILRALLDQDADDTSRLLTSAFV